MQLAEKPLWYSLRMPASKKLMKKLQKGCEKLERKYAVITGFLGKIKDRFIDYQPPREIEEMMEMASRIKGCSGLEVVYPQNFNDPVLVKSLLKQYGLEVSTVNLNVKGDEIWRFGSFSAPDPKARKAAVEALKHAMDCAAEFGCNMITTAPLNDGADYPFAQINTDEEPFIFSLVVPDNTNIEVSFTAHWGMSSSYDFDSGINYIVNGDSLIVETSTEGFVSSDEDASSEQAITDQAKNTNTDSSTEKTNDSTIEEMPDKSDEQDTDADSSLDSSATDTTADQSSDAENDIDSSTDNSTTDTGDTEPTKDDPGH